MNRAVHTFSLAVNEANELRLFTGRVESTATTDVSVGVIFVIVIGFRAAATADVR